MEKITNRPFYKVTEDVDRSDWHNEVGARSYTRDTDVFADDVLTAKACALGLVAQKMYALNNLKSAQTQPSKVLEAFLTWEKDTGAEENNEPAVRTLESGPNNDFNKFDEVIWTIQLISGEDFDNHLMVYTSNEEDSEVVERLLSEAMFLTDYVKSSISTSV